MKNEKLFKRACDIGRFYCSVEGREGDYALGEDKWEDAFVLDELLFVQGVYDESGGDYQDALEHGTAEEKKQIRSEMGKLKRLIAAYVKLGVKPESMSKHYGF
jgi:hypothetical protein